MTIAAMCLMSQFVKVQEAHTHNFNNRNSKCVCCHLHILSFNSVITRFWKYNTQQHHILSTYCTFSV